MKITVIFQCAAMLLFFRLPISTEETVTYRCGIAVGFPPYQFIDRQGRPAGIDYEITKAVFDRAGLKVVFVQKEWDLVMFGLAHKTGDADFLCGAEVSEERSQLFNFSDECYKRVICIFVLEKSDIRGISGLNGKIIAGDRHSYYERYLVKEKLTIRLMQTKSKEESFMKLRDETAAAVIAPLEVGNYVSRSLSINVRVLGEKDHVTPVAFAVGKEDTFLLNKINGALRQLTREGAIERIMRKYASPSNRQ